MIPMDDDLSNDLAGEDSMDSSAAPSLSSDSTPPPALPAPASPAVTHTPKTSSKKVSEPLFKQFVYCYVIKRGISRSGEDVDDSLIGSYQSRISGSIVHYR